MKCVVTAGPTYEELDEVRRLTNFSTGSLGCGLADHLAGLGHEVELLAGYYSTCAPPAKVQRRQTFTTTADLRRRLAALASTEIGAVFHVAAVSDFTFGKVWERGPSGELLEIKAAKIPTRTEGLLAELKPTPKIIRELRGWFPQAFLVGWKYELDDAGKAMDRARNQMKECQTNACVVNGRAYGPDGYGLLEAGGGWSQLPDREALFAALESKLNDRG